MMIAFVNMECKENDVNDADIDDRFPADIKKAANRATLTFINKLADPVNFVSPTIAVR
jgi:hypothetical protein